MSADLWTPDASITRIHKAEMDQIEAMHVVAQKYDIVLACSRCRQPFQGANLPTDPVRTIACGCRHLKG